MEEIAGFLAPFRQKKARCGLFCILKTAKPGRETGLGVRAGVQTSGHWAKSAHSKKAFPVGKAFKI
uniref:hypothetical protein n=1 Tax=Aeromonas sobria TaxID=646 RepID=UPI0019D5CB64